MDEKHAFYSDPGKTRIVSRTIIGPSCIFCNGTGKTMYIGCDKCMCRGKVPKVDEDGEIDEDDLITCDSCDVSHCLYNLYRSSFRFSGRNFPHFEIRIRYQLMMWADFCCGFQGTGHKLPDTCRWCGGRGFPAETKIEEEVIYEQAPDYLRALDPKGEATKRTAPKGE